MILKICGISCRYILTKCACIAGASDEKILCINPEFCTPWSPIFEVVLLGLLYCNIMFHWLCMERFSSTLLVLVEKLYIT